ncbi:MAG: M48 family metallopeptidase [Proteobacteria bacterium]|nr:M48 family metallopeptidase [Pseudomonadota bacterium]
MTAPAPLGLSTYRWNNNLKSTVLLLAFPFLLLLLVGGIFFFFGLLMRAGGGANAYDRFAAFEMFDLQPVLGSASPFDLALSAVYAWWPIVFGVAAVWVLIGYFFNDAIIHMATGAKPVTRQEQPELYNLLENLCISRGLKTPNLYVIQSDALNAYASGIDEKSYAITVTSGLLATLNKDELEAVLGHELTHIMDRDCRLLIVTIVFTGMISFMAQMMWRSLRFASFRARGKGAGGVAILMLIAAVMLFVGYVLALILRLALSRRRELLADAGSVDLTKNPGALISALRKISVNPEIAHVPTEVRQMFIENAPSAFDLGGLFATHPPIEERIRILERLGGLPDDASGAAAAAPPQTQSAPKSPWA